LPAKLVELSRERCLLQCGPVYKFIDSLDNLNVTLRNVFFTVASFPKCDEALITTNFSMCLGTIIDIVQSLSNNLQIIFNITSVQQLCVCEYV